ncbi:MAG TPA: IS110 family transposase [Thermoanaerobaculia bacterium]|jgi:transposase
MRNRTAIERDVFWVAFDDHADKVVAAVLMNDEAKLHEWFEVVPDEKGLRQLIKKLKGYEGEVRCIYEAGPCGFVLQRRLAKEGIPCSIAAPSLTPRQPGNRVKTDRRDAKKLVFLYRAGTLTTIHIPDQEQEALRDLVRAREDAVEEARRSRNRLGKFLLRHGHRYRGKTTWSREHWRWIRSIELEQQYSRQALEAYIAAVVGTEDQLKRLDEQVSKAADACEKIVRAYATLRGIDRLSAITVYAELGDLKRFRGAPEMMSAVGLVPSENSSGNTQRRGSITKTGNAHVRRVLVEAAWHARHRPVVGEALRRRREEQPPEIVGIAKQADVRLHRKFTGLTWRNKRTTVAAVAVARELAGFFWAIGQAL